MRKNVFVFIFVFLCAQLSLHAADRRFAIIIHGGAGTQKADFAPEREAQVRQAMKHTCGVSCSGTGEFFMRTVTAHAVSALMEYKNLLQSSSSSRQTWALRRVAARNYSAPSFVLTFYTSEEISSL